MGRYKRIGYFMAAFGGICWAFSGACGQYLFMNRGLNADWLVSVRLTVAGILLTTYSLARWRGKAVKMFRSARDVGALVAFGLLGLALCQYAFFRSIELSNAATATTLQYTGPAIVLVWLAVREKRMPSKQELLAVVCAIVGVYLLATHGDPTQLTLSAKAFIWCAIGACAFAVYSIQPRTLIARYDTVSVTGFGMLFGGIVLSIIFKPWNIVGQWDVVTVCGLVVIVLFGTICSFCCYLEGVRRIGAAKGSIIAAVEPVTSAILSVFWLGVPLQGMDYAGIAFIVVAVILLAGKDDAPNCAPDTTEQSVSAVSDHIVE